MAKKSDYTLPLVGAGVLAGAYFLFLRKRTPPAVITEGGMEGGGFDGGPAPRRTTTTRGHQGPVGHGPG